MVKCFLSRCKFSYSVFASLFVIFILAMCLRVAACRGSVDSGLIEYHISVGSILKMVFAVATLVYSCTSTEIPSFACEPSAK